MIGNYEPVREHDRFEIDGVEWRVDEVRTPGEDNTLPDHAEPQCFLVEWEGDRERQYTEQYLLNGASVTRRE